MESRGTTIKVFRRQPEHVTLSSSNPTVEDQELAQRRPTSVEEPCKRLECDSPHNILEPPELQTSGESESNPEEEDDSTFIVVLDEENFPTLQRQQPDQHRKPEHKAETEAVQRKKSKKFKNTSRVTFGLVMTNISGTVTAAPPVRAREQPISALQVSHRVSSQPAPTPDMPAVVAKEQESAAEGPATEEKLQAAETSNKTASTSDIPAEPSVETEVPAAVEGPRTIETSTLPAPAPEPSAVLSKPVAEPHPLLKLIQVTTPTNQKAAQTNTVNNKLTRTQSFLTIPEVEFYKTLGDKDEKISTLQQQNGALLNEVKRLHAYLYQSQQLHSLAANDACRLREEVKKERIKRQEAESSLAQQLDETSKIKAGLTQSVTRLKDQQRDAIRENAALSNEVQQLKKELQNQKDEKEKATDVLYVELRKRERLNADATCTISKLESGLRTEKSRAKEAETSLAVQMEENSKIKAGLLQIQKDFDGQKRQWEQDKTHLLEEQIKTTTNMKEAVMENEKSLENERKQWQEEKSGLLQMLSAMKETLEKKEEERKQSADSLMERITSLEEQMGKIPTKKAKKKSVRKRFLQLFK